MPPDAEDLNRRARPIRFLLMDVDGVLTDGRIILLPGIADEEVKSFDSKDGLGMMLARRAGIGLGLLSGRSAGVVARRARDLGIVEVLQGRLPKTPAYLELRDRLGLTDAEVCYMGDDIVDVPLLRLVGLGVAPADAHPEARRAAAWVTERPGGRGAVREVIDRILRAQDRWDTVVRPLLEESED